MVSHMDHTEHDVNIIITEQGVADLRGKSPKERAQAIIENCVHPDYKNILWDYLKLTDASHRLPMPCAPHWLCTLSWPKWRHEECRLGTV